MRKIELTQGKIALVDDADYEKLNQFKWYASRHRQAWYAKRNIRIDGKKTTIHMHREILNAPEGIQIDHIDGNSLDNCKENLRLCTHQQNAFNKRLPHKNNKLGIKGVHWREDVKKFRAMIMVGGKTIHLGCFNVMGDADSAYRIAEDKYFGEFARTI